MSDEHEEPAITEVATRIGSTEADVKRHGRPPVSPRDVQRSM